MKNKFFISVIFIFSTIIFSNCQMQVESKTTLSRPDVQAQSSSGIIISRSVLSGTTKYVNIYRRDITNTILDVADSASQAQAAASPEMNQLPDSVNIGLIYPRSNSSSDQTITFEDSYVIKNHKYQYYFRYCENDETGDYYSTEWSDIVTAINGLPESTTITYKYPEDAYFLFDSETYTLTLVGSVVNPSIPDFATTFLPVMAFSNGITTQVFKIPANTISINESLNLREILPQSFLDTPISMLGVIGQKIEYVPTNVASKEEPDIYRIIWTVPAKIKINKYDTIVVKSSGSIVGFDYSRKAK